MDSPAMVPPERAVASAGSGLARLRVPAEMVVRPVWELVPERVRVPVPDLVRATMPAPAPELLRMVPEKLELPFPAPTVRVEVPEPSFWMMPAPVIPLMVSLKPLRLRVPRAFTLTDWALVRTSLLPRMTFPPLMVRALAKALAVLERVRLPVPFLMTPRVEALEMVPATSQFPVPVKVGWPPDPVVALTVTLEEMVARLEESLVKVLVVLVVLLRLMK